MAIAPPQTFIRSWEISKCCMKRSTTEAKASFNSNRSMSEIFIFACFRSFSVTSIGPVSISAGSEPILVKARIFARGVSPIALPPFFEPRRTRPEPSTIPEELPAW